MSVFQRLTSLVILALTVAPCLAQEGGGHLSLELNAVAETGGTCRLTFVAENATALDVERAVFETVVFGTDGGVLLLTLFDFQDLPATRQRVRQFDLADVPCARVGRLLINGVNECAASSPAVCSDGLVLKTRLDIELLG